MTGFPPTVRRFPVVAGALAIASLAGVACGGGGGSAGLPPPDPVVPDVAMLFVSGHTWGSAPTSYLHEAGNVGPALVAAVESLGLTVAADYFVDHGSASGSFGGYVELVLALRDIADTSAPHGTRTVVVAHSHGGVWAHDAIQRFPELSIFAIVDLDVSSYSWSLVGHDAQNHLLGGDPRDAWTIGDTTYDTEDVVFSNVAWALEVRSGELAAFSTTEYYDDAWNVRPTGTTFGITPYFSATSHAEVRSAAGTTAPYVVDWLLDRLTDLP